MRDRPQLDPAASEVSVVPRGSRFVALPISLALAFVMVALELPPAGAQTPPERPRPPQMAQGPPFVPGELLVRFRPAATPAERASVRGRHGLQKVQDLPLPGLELVRAPGRSIPDLAAAVAREAAVRDAEPNHLWFPAQVPPPNDPEFGHLWGLHNTGQTPPGGSPGTPGKDIAALAGWERALDTAEVVVAVIDTGVWTEHPDLQEASWLNRGELPPPNGPQCAAPADDPHDCDGDGVFNVLDYEGDSRVPGPAVPTPEQVRVAFQSGEDDDGNGRIDDIVGWNFVGNSGTVFDPLHGDDHGTHVAGTIAATIDNGIGVAGASRARIMPLKFLGPQGGTTANAILALDYALQMGAHVTNNSWGGGGESTFLQAKIAEADQAGQLFVAAAGNGDQNGNGIDIDTTPFYPASYPNPNIIAVAATTNTDGLASFSNYGATSVDVGAPGVSILSTVPRFSKAVLRERTASTGAVAYHTFGLEGISSASQRQALLGAALSWMHVGASDPILLVDDDGGRTFQTTYQNALGALGYTNIATQAVGAPNTPCNQHGPSAATMAAYRAVIWITGDTFRCTLTSTDRGNITTYVNGESGASPRNFLLFGQDIGFDLTNGGEQTSSFMQNTLRADLVSDADLNFRLSAVTGSPYAGLADLELIRSPLSAGGQFFSSGIAPRTGAVTGLRGADTTWFPGTSMAAPHVTGIVAHVLAKYPQLGHAEVKSRIMDRGDSASSLAGKTVSGKRVNLAGALTGAAPPTDVTAVPRPAGAIELAWIASPGPALAGYRVHRGTAPGFPASAANVVSGPDPISGTSFTDTTPSDGVTYHYIVRAWDSFGGEGPSSNEAVATADASPPTVTDRLPLPGATSVGIGTQVKTTFSEPIDPDSVTTDTFLLSDPAPVQGSVVYDSATRTATFTPLEALDHATEHTARVTGEVADLAGNTLVAPVVWSFTTVTDGDTTPPSLAITSPEEHVPHTGTSLLVGGVAADDVGIQRVDVSIQDTDGRFWDGASFVDVDGDRIWHQASVGDAGPEGFPWSYVWEPLPEVDGTTYVAEARAVDLSANQSALEVRDVIVDTVAPQITLLELAGGRPATADPDVPVTLEAIDGHSGPGDLEMRFAVGAAPTASWDPYEAGFLVRLGDTAPDAPYTIQVQMRDEAGNEGKVEHATILLDGTPPSDPRIVAPTVLFQRGRRFRVSWAAEDPVSGVESYRVQHRSRRWNGNGAGWQLWTATDQDGDVFPGRPGTTHCFRVRAEDGAGNLSGPSPARCTTVPLNDGALRRQGGWRRVTGRPAHYLGSFVRTGSQGATLRKPGIRRAEGAALVFTSCPRCGRVEVRWNGRRVQRLNLRSAQRRSLRVRRIPGVSGRGVLEVVVLSRSRPVIIEGLGVAVRP